MIRRGVLYIMKFLGNSSQDPNFFLRIALVGLLGPLAGVLAWSAAHAGEPARQPAPALSALGRKLFFDARLSRDGSVSCSSCHQPAHAFTDGRKVSVGVGKRIGTRNTPSLLNVFDGEPLFWDGRRDRLEVAVLDPLTNPVEMGQPDLDTLTRRISERPDYQSAIASAFPGTRRPSGAQLGAAIAAFIRSLPQQRSAYDRYAAGQHDALAFDAADGLRLFDGKAGCSGCHRMDAARFTDGQFHHSGVGLRGVDSHLGELTTQAMQRDLQGSALGNDVAQHAERSALGRFMVSHNAVDVGAFRTPSLRNVAATAPYMHDGSIGTLEEAVDTEIYYRGLSTGRPIALTVEERRHLLAFLRSLTAAPGR
jgi:cytochrome c peroxidase